MPILFGIKGREASHWPELDFSVPRDCRAVSAALNLVTAGIALAKWINYTKSWPRAQSRAFTSRLIADNVSSRVIEC
jgi:hypothetical protein